MTTILERKALIWAVLSSFSAMGLTTLAAIPIKSLESDRNSQANTIPPNNNSTIQLPSVSEGKSFFAMSCAQCHASDATGDEGPDLHNLSLSNARIVKTIRSGIKGEMPSFSKKYNEKEIASIVIYLRTLK